MATSGQSRAVAGAAVRCLRSIVTGVTRPCPRQHVPHLRCFSAENTDVSQPRLSVAVVGAGPSGFYTSKYLASAVLHRIEKANDRNDKRDEGDPPALSPFDWSGIDVDILERLPTPYGLVRYGVAPDHPEVKNVEHDFAAQFETSNNNPSSSLSFFGGVEVGKDVKLSALQSMYDVVVLAYGCQAADRRLNIPGEDLEGVLSAREFVAWYNGHPEFGHIGTIVKECLWGSSDISKVDDDQVSTAKVVVVGQGNVALDVARILAKGKRGLIETDTPSSVLEILKGGASHVSILGRRGHVQGAFTIKELRELTKLNKEGHNAKLIIRRGELELGMNDSSVAELKGASGRPKTRIDKLLRDSAVSETDNPKDEAPKTVCLRFLLSPTSIEAKDSDGGRVGGVVCERTRLEGGPFKQNSVSTGEIETLPADLVLTSIGYKGMPLEGMKGRDQFDHQQSVVNNLHGKVTGDNNLFASGWIKRGPSGIIGTNIMDAKDTVKSIMMFIEENGRVRDEKDGRRGLEKYLEAHETVPIRWENFQAIEVAETDPARLRNDAQPREKILQITEMESIAGILKQ
mmetsp:Transcript_11114/g.25914  ORF Transcript_11114/g.25914 Transcript_11114/m.25914 type:complete len:572 (+) Transcript_11114:108-1823(+)